MFSFSSSINIHTVPFVPCMEKEDESGDSLDKMERGRHVINSSGCPHTEDTPLPAI